MKLRRREADADFGRWYERYVDANTDRERLHGRIAELEAENRRLHAALATAGPLTATLEDIIRWAVDQGMIRAAPSDSRLAAVLDEALRQSRLRVR